MSKSTIIIGGGVIGLSIAATLAMNNYAVTVVASDAGDGKFASGTPTGILLPWDGAKKHEKRITAFALWRQWSNTIETNSSIAVDYEEIGTLRIERVDDRTLSGEGDWTLLHERGLTLGEAIAEYTGLSLPGATLTPKKLLHALLVIINKFGGNIIHDSIIDMNFNGFSVKSLTGKNGATYSGDSFVLAAGVGAGAFLTELGITESIIGDGGEVLQVSSKKHPPSILYIDDFMIVPKLDGSSWVAGIHRKFENEATFIKEDAARLLDVAKKALGTETVRIGAWAGVRPKVQNRGEAIVEVAPLAKNVIVAAGHSSNGILLSPLVAQEVFSLLSKAKI